MDWQQIAALAIVGITTVLLIGSRLRRRKFTFERDTHCGCNSCGNQTASIRFHARKGERPRIEIREPH